MPKIWSPLTSTLLQVPGLESDQILHFNLPKASLHISQAGLSGPLTDSIANLLMKNWRAWRLKISCLSRHIRKLPGWGGKKKGDKSHPAGLRQKTLSQTNMWFHLEASTLARNIPTPQWPSRSGKEDSWETTVHQSTLGLTSPSVNVRKCSGILLAFYF